MSYLKWWEKVWMSDPLSKESVSGDISVDHDKCTGCGLCIKICPADMMSFISDEEKYPQYKGTEEDFCVACGACHAICPKEAITLTVGYRFPGRFKRPRLGELQPPRLFKELRTSN